MLTTRLTATAAFLLCIAQALTANELASLNLIPMPRQVILQPGVTSLPNDTRILIEDPKLMPLAKLLSHNVSMQTGKQLPMALVAPADNGIILRINTDLKPEEYKLTIGETIVIEGGDYQATVWGTTTLLQLMSEEDGKLSFPRVTITDAPDYGFRSVMLDLARRWHPMETVKQTVDLLSLYKINFLHLHLSDTQSCVYTSRVLPKMASPQAYSWDEMQELVRYADARGVTIIPEIDVPGHCSSWVQKMPEQFGTTDPATGQHKPLGIVNMANERSYEALDQLVGELSEVFASSPYIHMGTDETGAGGLINLPEYQPYCKRHGLKEAAEGRAHELFLHFIERMNQIVRKHGKQAIAWNDFGGASTANVSIPTDVTAMYWVGSVDAIASKGYPIINCCRLPLYIVPPQQSAPEDHRIYAWNAHSFANWHSPDPVMLPKSAPIKGAQICFWEQRYNEVIPILRPRVPAFAERLWNEDAGRTIKDLRRRRQHTDDVAQNIIEPVRFSVSGLIGDQEVEFENSMTVKLSSSFPGTIRYTLNKQWEAFPGPTSDVAPTTIKLGDTMTVSARLFDADGNGIGGITQQRFRKMVPAYRYRLLGPTPARGWPAMPDFNQLKVLQTGVTGLMDRDRGEQINRSMFAGLNPNGHIDVRLHNVYNPFTLELTGQFKLPFDGDYTFKLMSQHGISELNSNNHSIVAAKVPGREYIVKGTAPAGTYPLTIKHFYRDVRNELNIWVKTPGATEYVPFETLVVPMSQWVANDELQQLPADCKFVDPVALANINLATNKPVKSPGWQENWVPANAVDGIADNTSGWHADPYPQWLQVDLEKQYSINRIKLYPYYDGRRHYQYTIEVSQNGKDWKQVVDMTKNVKPSTKEGDEHNFAAVQGRYVRVNMLTNSVNPGVHVNELMVFEEKTEGE